MTTAARNFALCQPHFDSIKKVSVCLANQFAFECLLGSFVIAKRHPLHFSDGLQMDRYFFLNSSLYSNCFRPAARDVGAAPGAPQITNLVLDTPFSLQPFVVAEQDLSDIRANTEAVLTTTEYTQVKLAIASNSMTEPAIAA